MTNPASAIGTIAMPRDFKAYSNTVNAPSPSVDTITPPHYLFEHKMAISWVQEAIKEFSEIEAVYRSRSGDMLEVHIVGNFPEPAREDAFYRKEAQWLSNLPVGLLSVSFTNRHNFEGTFDFVPPKDSVPFQLHAI